MTIVTRPPFATAGCHEKKIEDYLPPSSCEVCSPWSICCHGYELVYKVAIIFTALGHVNKLKFFLKRSTTTGPFDHRVKKPPTSSP